MEAVLQKIIAFADACHGDQMRRYVPGRYIVHPIRVMETLKPNTSDITILAAALLHDVLEDTAVTKEDIKTFLQTVMTDEEADRTINLVVELTDVFVKSAYPKWNRRTRKNKENERLEKISPEAQTIKYADIIDNAPEVAEMDADFAKRFLPEYKALLKKIPNGHPELYKRATDTVNDCLAEME